MGTKTTDFLFGGVAIYRILYRIRFALILAASARLSSAGIVDPSFQCVLGSDDGEVLAAVAQSDGSTLIGGKFTSVAGVRRMGVARILADGSVDPGFNGGAIAGTVYALAVDPDNRIVIGGDFTLINGVRRVGIARLTSNGSLDGGFDPGAGAMLTAQVAGTVSALAVESGGKVIAGGNFRFMNGKPRALVARFESSGAVDDSFDPGDWVTASSQAIRALAVNSGQIYAGGSFAAKVDSSSRRNVARLHNNGTLDLGFDPGGASDLVNALLPESDGSVTAAGYRFVRRFRFDGTRDDGFREPDFSKSQFADVKALTHALGGYVIGGDFRQIRTGQNFLGVTYGQGKFVAVDSGGGVWASSDGSAWSVTASASSGALRGITFGNGTFVAVGHNGTVVISPDAMDWTPYNSRDPEAWNGVAFGQGQFVAVGAAIDGSGAILTSPDGRVWTRRDSRVRKTLRAVTCRLDERWIAVGQEGTVVTSPDGVEWTEGASGTTNTLNAVAAMDGAGSVVAVGRNGTLIASTDGTQWVVRQSGTIDALHAVSTGLGKFTLGGGWGSLRSTVNGTNWFALYSPTLLNLNATAASPSTMVFVGDSEVILTSPNQQTWTQQRNQAVDVRYLALLDSGGILQTNFNSTIGKGLGILLSTSGESVRAVQATQMGKLFVGGSFLRVDNFRSPDFTRLMRDGTRDTNFNVGTGVGGATTPGALLRQPDGQILLGGDFTSVNGTFVNRITRLNPDGSIDPNFNAGCDPSVSNCGADRAVLCLARQADGRILLGGYFNTIQGASRRGVARLFPNGDVDLSFNQPASSPAYNSSISVLAVQSDGRVLIDGSSKRLMRLETNGVPDASFNIGAGVLGGYVSTLLLPGDGQILVGGSFTNIHGVAANRLARLDSSGGVDLEFQTALGSGANGSVDTMILQWDEALKKTFLMVAGGFTQFNGMPRGRVLRLELDGKLDPDFDPGVGTDKNISLLATYYNTTAAPLTYMAGDFIQFAGYPRSRVARWIGGVGLDPGFNTGSGPNGRVSILTLVDGNRLLLGGGFTTVEDEPWSNLALLRVGDTAPAPLEEWRSQYFTVAEQADSSISGDGADPDGDGIKNFAEYAFALDPRVASQTGLPTGQVETDAGSGTESLVLAFRRRVGTSGVRYAVELSDDLSVWEAAGGRLQILKVTPDPGGTSEVIRARVAPPIGELQKSFVRVALTKE